MPATPAVWLDDFLVNFVTAGAQENPRVTQLLNGNIMVVWDSANNTGAGSPPGFDVIGQVFSPLGIPIGVEFLVNGFNANVESVVDIAALTNGGAIAVYQDFISAGGGSTSIRYTMLNTDGTEITSITVSSDLPGGGSFSAPRVAVAGGTGLFAYVFNDGGTSRILGKLFNASSGTITSLELPLLNLSPLNNQLDIAALANGTFVVVSNSDNGLGDTTIGYAVINAAGAVIGGGGFITASTGGTDDDSDPSVTALTGGGFVVTWTSFDGTDQVILGQVFDNNGFATVAPFNIDAVIGTNAHTASSVVALPDGGFLVVFNDNTNNVTAAQHFDLVGNKLGSQRDIGTSGAGQIDTELLDDGRVAITFRDSSGEVRMEFVDTRDSANTTPVYTPQRWQIGTVGIDAIFAGADTDFVAGHTGNDLLSAGVGAVTATFFGGDGDDSISAGTQFAGNAFDGGAGNDTINWIAFGERGLTLNMATGTASNGLGPDVSMTGFEHLFGTINDDSITGNNDDNTLSGNDGNDTMAGGAGADRLFGGNGNDTFLTTGDGTNDSTFGGAGNDTFMLANLGLSGDFFGDAGADDRIDASGVTNRGLAFNLTAQTYQDAGPTSELTGVEHVNGGQLGDTITGNTLTNLLSGLGGDDTLTGGDGNDTLDGGAGNDSVFGGAGNDVILTSGDGTDDASFGDAGNDTFALSNTFLAGNIDGGANSDLIDGSAVTNRGLLFNLDDGIYQDVGPTFDLTSVEHVKGGQLNDIIIGNTLTNSLFGLGGSDTLTAAEGHDVLFGGNGIDMLFGGNGNDFLSGDNADNFIQSNGTDTLFGGDGDDQFNTRGQFDASFGGNGNDTYILDDIDFAGNFNAGAGALGGTNDKFDATAVTQAGFNVNLTAGTYLDTITAFTLTFVEHATGGQLSDRLAGNTVANSLDGQGGNDTLFGAAGADQLFGQAGNDTLFGGSDSDVLSGESGNDTLEGGAGTDNLFGGSGNDLFNILAASGFDNLQGGVDIDTVSFAGVTENIDAQLGAGFYKANGGASFTLVGLEHAVTGLGNDTLGGTSGANSLSGGAGNDVFQGDAGNDTLFGGAGDDILTGQDNADQIFGGANNDIVAVSDLRDISVEGGTGTDTLLMGAAFNQTFDMTTGTLTGGTAPPATLRWLGFENYLSIAAVASNETVNGTATANAISFEGNAGTHTANGGAGNDSLTGGTGVDSFRADDGDDNLFLGDGADLALGGAGNDTINGDAGNDTFGGDAGNDTLFGGTGDDLMGSLFAADDGDNTIFGGDGNDGMIGDTGLDLLNGGAGDDIMISVGGPDRLTGGVGNDTYFVADQATVIVEGAGEGTADAVSVGVNYVLAANLDIEVMGTVNSTLPEAIDITGNTLRQAITGTGGVNRLSDGGGAGADTLTGLAGNDIYIIGNSGTLIVEATGAGNDTVQVSVSFGLAADDDVEILTTTLATDIGVLDLTGNAFVQAITGNAGANRLADGGGDGADRLTGLGGNDTYIIGNDKTVIVEGIGGGTKDRVLASVSFVLAADDNIERLATTLASGTGGIDLTGNAANQLMSGNRGNNVFDGGGGRDRMIGGAGNDTYVTDGGDKIREKANGGKDTVESSANHILRANIERLILTGNTEIDGTGNKQANILIGNDNDNVLNGRAGKDRLTGGAGDDTFVFDATPGRGNIDRVTDFNRADDTMELDGRAFAGIGNGAVDVTEFKANRSGNATDASDRIVYETDTGKLFYDVDGDGAAQRVQFAVLNPRLGVSEADFLVF